MFPFRYKYLRGISTIGEFGHSLCLTLLLTYILWHIHDLRKLFPVPLTITPALLLIYLSDLNSSDEKVCTNMTTLVKSVAKTCLL